MQKHYCGIAKAYRKAKGYTQERLGELVGVSGQAVSKWENGGIPDTYLLPAIANTLDVSIDHLFGTEKKVTDFSQDEILDILFEYCKNTCHFKNKEFDKHKFIFEMLWTVHCAYMGNDERCSLQYAIDVNKGNPQVTSQIIDDKGTTYLTLVENFQFFCAVLDNSEISKKILSEEHFVQFFSLLASEAGLKAVLFSQSSTESSQYTAQAMAKKIGISQEEFNRIEPLLVKYSFLSGDTLTFDDKVIKVYRKNWIPEIRSLLVMAYQFINARQCYYNFVSYRTTPYFELDTEQNS